MKMGRCWRESETDVEGFYGYIRIYEEQKKECGKLWIGGDAVEAAQTWKGLDGDRGVD